MFCDTTRNDDRSLRRLRRSALAVAPFICLVFRLQATPVLAADQEELRSRVTELHAAISSSDLAALYSLSSLSVLPDQQLSFSEFKRFLGLDDTYGSRLGWGLRQSIVKDICTCENYEYPAGARVLRCPVLVDLVFDDNQKVEVSEVWESIQGQWYWSHSDARQGCDVAR